MSIESPEVSIVAGRIVVSGLDACPACGARWVAWIKGMDTPKLPGRPRSQAVRRAYARLRCAEGHLTEI